MPFNSHRSMVPRRPRYSMNASQSLVQTRQLPPQRPMPPQRASSYDPHATPSSPITQINQIYTPISMSQNSFDQQTMIPTTSMAYPPFSAEYDTACFSKGATPEATLNADLWSDGLSYSSKICLILIKSPVTALKIHNTTNKLSDFDDFGLGLNALSTDLSSSTVKGDTELFDREVVLQYPFVGEGNHDIRIGGNRELCGLECDVDHGDRDITLTGDGRC